MIRSAGTVLLLTMTIAAIPARTEGQFVRRSNPVLTWQTPDAAALDTTGRGFLEYGTGGETLGYTAEAGIGTRIGMLRAIYAHSYSQTVWGVGYARMLATADAGKLGTLGAGIDVGAAMDFRQRSALASRAARVSIPLSLRWGSPSRLSIAPYVAPFGEIGRTVSYQLAGCDTGFCSVVPAGLVQTRGLGLASGVQLTAWRLSFEIGLSDLPRTEFGYSGYHVGAGLRFRF